MPAPLNNQQQRGLEGDRPCEKGTRLSCRGIGPRAELKLALRAWSEVDLPFRVDEQSFHPRYSPDGVHSLFDTLHEYAHRERFSDQPGRGKERYGLEL